MNGVPWADVVSDMLPASSAERLSALFDLHYEQLYRLARRLAPSADDAQDLVQETFLRAARSPRSVPLGPRDEEAWLVRVLINISRDHWRKLAVRQRHAEQTMTSAIAADDQEAVLVARATVWHALDTLTPRRRAVIVMHELEGMTIPSIASLLGVTAITVRWHLSVGRRDLARLLKCETGDTHEDR
jgi:RNA polymerase sigma-70 factor (ECF subfamily)